MVFVLLVECHMLKYDEECSLWFYNTVMCLTLWNIKKQWWDTKAEYPGTINDSTRNNRE